MAGVMARINYVSDDGNTYVVRQDASNQAATGNLAATVTTGLPGRHRPRYILARHPTTGRERKIVVGSIANAMWVGGTATITLPDFDDDMAPVVYNIAGRIGEKRYMP
jgi:hypothetical protein